MTPSNAFLSSCVAIASLFVSVDGPVPTAFAPPTQEALESAVAAWLADPEEARARLGDIGAWDVSRVANMTELFCGLVQCAKPRGDAFNEDLAAWDVGGVVDFSRMFAGAAAFDQDLGWCADATLVGAFAGAACEATACGVRSCEKKRRNGPSVILKPSSVQIARPNGKPYVTFHVIVLVPVLALALASLWFCCPCVGSIHPYTRRRTAVRQSPPARTRSLELPEH